MYKFVFDTSQSSQEESKPKQQKEQLQQKKPIVLSKEEEKHDDEADESSQSQKQVNKRINSISRISNVNKSDKDDFDDSEDQQEYQQLVKQFEAVKDQKSTKGLKQLRSKILELYLKKQNSVTQFIQELNSKKNRSKQDEHALQELESQMKSFTIDNAKRMTTQILINKLENIFNRRKAITFGNIQQHAKQKREQQQQPQARGNIFSSAISYVKDKVRSLSGSRIQQPVQQQQPQQRQQQQFRFNPNNVAMSQLKKLQESNDFLAKKLEQRDYEIFMLEDELRRGKFTSEYKIGQQQEQINAFVKERNNLEARINQNDRKIENIESQYQNQIKQADSEYRQKLAEERSYQKVNEVRILELEEDIVQLKKTISSYQSSDVQKQMEQISVQKRNETLIEQIDNLQQQNKSLLDQLAQAQTVTYQMNYYQSNQFQQPQQHYTQEQLREGVRQFFERHNQAYNQRIIDLFIDRVSTVGDITVMSEDQLKYYLDQYLENEENKKKSILPQINYYEPQPIPGPQPNPNAQINPLWPQQQMIPENKQEEIEDKKQSDKKKEIKKQSDKKLDDQQDDKEQPKHNSDSESDDEELLQEASNHFYEEYKNSKDNYDIDKAINYMVDIKIKDSELRQSMRKILSELRELRKNKSKITQAQNERLSAYKKLMARAYSIMIELKYPYVGRRDRR